jgi:hypothetical protein
LLETPVPLRKQLSLSQRPAVVSAPLRPLLPGSPFRPGPVRQEIWQ